MPATASNPQSTRPLRLLVLHARADRHHAFALQQALRHQPRAADLRLLCLDRQGESLGLLAPMTELQLAKVDAIVFLVSPRYFAEYPDWAARVRRAQQAPKGAYLLVAEPLGPIAPVIAPLAKSLPSNALWCDPRGDWPRMLKLADELCDQLFPQAPIRDVLCMFANPGNLDQLALHREMRAIEDANREAGHTLELETLWATRVHDVQTMLLGGPRDVIHFSGHGEPGGLYFETADGHPQLVETNRLLQVLANHGPRCLVFNACHSADMIVSARERVHHVIAMQGPTPDAAAIEFSRAFYAALARGKSVDLAFEHAFDGVGLHGFAEGCRPRLV